jgi:hypothetical protein
MIEFKIYRFSFCYPSSELKAHRVVFSHTKAIDSATAAPTVAMLVRELSVIPMNAAKGLVCVRVGACWGEG